jgi:hypothetical protein
MIRSERVETEMGGGVHVENGATNQLLIPNIKMLIIIVLYLVEGMT